nr:hypothetical protein [Streptomyces sp. DSM 40907]
MRRDTLRAVLHRSGPPADEAADLLGLRPGTEFCPTAFAPAATAGADPAVLTQAEWVLMRHCAAHRAAAATVAAAANAVYVLLPETGPAAGRRFADGALAAVRRSAGDGARAAVSRPYTDLGPSAALRREVDGILRATAHEGPGGPAATTFDVRRRILPDRLGDELERDAWLRLPEADALLAHDRAQGTDYGNTAIAWLDATGDIASAAARLKLRPTPCATGCGGSASSSTSISTTRTYGSPHGWNSGARHRRTAFPGGRRDLAAHDGGRAGPRSARASRTAAVKLAS